MTESPAIKRGLLRRRISYAIAIVLTGVIAGVLYHQSQLLPRRISTYVNNHYLRGTNFEFSIDGVSGFFLRHIRLTNPTLRYHSPSASYNVFRADEISVEYDLMPIFAFRLIVTELTLHNVDIHLRQDADGKLVLPVLPAGEKKSRFDVSPVVNVRRFGIDGLAVKFGGQKRELAVRDVNLAGSFEYADHAGRLRVDEGSAYLIDSKKTVSAIRLEAHGNGSSAELDDFAIRLDESFVIARGAFREGRLHDVNLVVNPISLPELHQLGLIGDEEGLFAGRVALDGPVDSLKVKGEISGKGLGVELSGVEFDGSVTPARLFMRSMKGAVFGTSVDGTFDLDIKSEDFVFDGSVENLDLGRGFIEDSELPPMSLTGKAWVRHTKNAGRYEWEGDLSRGVIDGFECFDVRAKGVFTETTGMVIERASLRRPGFKVDGKGTVSADDVVDIVFKVDATDLAYFWEHFKLPTVGGATTLNGRLRGPIDDFTVNLNGPFRNLKFEPALFDSGTVTAEARRIGTEAPEVTVAVGANRGAISGVWFDSPVVSLEIDTSRVQIRNARFARGDTSIVADLDVRPEKGENATIDVRRVTITTPTDVWETVRPSRIHVERGAMYVDSLVLACARGELGGEGAIRQRDRSLDFTAWGKGVNLTVVRDVAKLPFGLTGRGDFKLGLSGKMDDPHGRLDVAIHDGIVDSVAFDGLTARAEFDGSRYRVEHLQVVAGGDTVRARGAWNCAVSPMRIANGERTDSLWSAPISGRLEFAHFPLATLFRAMHKPPAVAAAYQGTLELGGTLEKPTARARGRIVREQGPGQQIPPAQLDVAYSDGALHVASFATTQPPVLKIDGTFPLEISFRDGARVNADRALDFRLDVTPGGEEPVEIGRYFDSVSMLRGVLSGNVVGSGTPRAPRLSGGLAFSRGDLRFVDLAEEFKDIAIRVDFIDDIVRLTSLSARSGDKGSMMATGWARMSNYKPVDYKLDLTAREFEVRSVSDVEIRSDGNLTLRPTKWRDGRSIPRITGKLVIKKADITVDITDTGNKGGGAEFTRPTDSPNWLATVDIDAEKNVWIRNPALSVELEGDLILNRDERGVYFRGDMNILRGSYYVYGNKFEITDGTFDFSASEKLRPSMQINAYTPYLGNSNLGGGSDQNINLALSWPYDQKEPRIKLSLEGAQGYSDSDIWALLGQNSLGAGMATNALEQVIDSQMTGGPDVQVGQRVIDPSSTTKEKETVVGIQQYLWSDIYLRYQRGLSSSSEQEVNVEYRLGRRFVVRSQLIYNSRRQSGGLAGHTTDEYNVDLKYRFEF